MIFDVLILLLYNNFIFWKNHLVLIVDVINDIGSLRLNASSQTKLGYQVSPGVIVGFDILVRIVRFIAEFGNRFEMHCWVFVGGAIGIP